MAENDDDPRLLARTALASHGPAVPAVILPLPQVHPALRWPLRAFKSLALLLAVGLLGNVLLLFFSVGPAGFLSAAYMQVAYVASLIAGNLPSAVAIAIVLLLLFGLSVLAERQFAAEQRRLHDVEAHDLATVAARETYAQDAPAIAAQVADVIEQRMREAAAAGAAIIASAPALASGVISPDKLPRIARLFGRSDQLDVALARLSAGSSLSVSAVEGMPGVGKTVFAAELVARAGAQGRFPGGAAWISCEQKEGADGLDAILADVATAIGQERIKEITEPSHRRAALYAALHAHDAPAVLLALDNIEPGLDDTALLDTLAGGCATLLLTARHAIADTRVSAFPLEQLAEGPAADLFRERLRQQDTCRPNAADEPLIADVVAAVGGLPLALDLTAARAALRHQPLDQAAREAREDGLVGLTARIDRSWAALSAAQRLLLAGLSLVEGASFPRGVALALASASDALSADLPGATASQSGAAVDAQAAFALDALVGLRVVEALADERLRLHPTIRQYATAKLAQQPVATQEALGEASAGWWLTFARANPGYDGMDALEAQAVGLMGAVTWANDHDHPRLLLNLVYALNRAWYVRGRRSEERRFQPWAIAAAKALESNQDLRFMTHSLAVLDRQTGRIAEARAGYEEALRLAQTLGDPSAIRSETHSLAVLDRQTGRIAEARAGYEEALRLAQALGDTAAIQIETHELALLDWQTGRIAEARAGYAEALRLAQALGDPAAIRSETHSLAVLDAQTGRIAEARAGYAEALRLAQALGDTSAIRSETHSLAVLDLQTGRIAEARAEFAQALRLAQALGDPVAAAVELLGLGIMDMEAGDIVAARRQMGEALRLAEGAQDAQQTAEMVWWLAELERLHGDHDAACAGFRRALEIYLRIGDPETEVTRERLRALGCES